MAKIFMSVGFFAILIFTLSSCSRFLRPTASASKKQNGKVNNNNNTDKNIVTSPKNVFDTSAFMGTTLKNIVYTTAPDYKGADQQLAFDVYKPANAGDKKFPAIFLMHGGSFKGGDKGNLASTCSKLANNGYVVISVNYRMGWGFTSRANTSCDDSVLFKEAVYRAVQDVHSALRYVANHADEYNIDRNWIFVGGQSAGAVAALIAAYLHDNDGNGFFSGYSQKLGSLDKEADNPNDAFTLKGVISMWGAFIDPQLITEKTALPTIFFQGQLDKAVPFNSGPFVPCSNATTVYGTYPLYNRLKDLGETIVAHVDPQGGHGVFEENFRISNILCFLNDVRQGIKKQVYLTGVQNSCDK